MNDINEMPPKCQYCPYWEVCEYPWVCPDREQLATNLKQTCNQLTTDTISRKAAIDAVHKSYDTILDFKTDGKTISSSIEDILSNLPPAQQEIIRCKDCKHGVDYYHEGDCYCSNPKWGLQYFGGSWEFYCADAERRTDG